MSADDLTVSQQELDDAQVSQEAQDAGPVPDEVRVFPATPGPAPPPPVRRRLRSSSQQDFSPDRLVR